MSISLHEWFQTPAGRYLLDWERVQFAQTVNDIFGFHALQLGMAELDALGANRMPHRWLADSALRGAAAAPPPLDPLPEVFKDSLPPEGAAPLRTALITDYAALPFAENSLDLVVMPHSLELNVDPHATLREVERVLVPEGRIVISGLNPASLWGLRQRRARIYRSMGFGELFLPASGEFIGYWRLRDWLRLLDFEVETGRFGCYRPAVSSEQWLGRFQWMDGLGQRWWPIFGAVYFIVAVKRVHGMRLMAPAWKTAAPIAAAPVTVANKARTSAGVITERSTFERD